MTWWEDTWLADAPGGMNVPMVILGLAILVAGLAVPGTETAVVMALIGIGAGTAAAGLVLNRYKQIEVGPTGFKVSRDANDAVPAPWLAVEAETLNKIAVRVLGDKNLGREAVEKSLTRVRRHRNDIPRSQIDIATYKTLVSELHRRDRNRRWPGTSAVESGGGPALQSLSFSARVALALSYEFLDGDVAAILDRPQDEIARDVKAAEAVLALETEHPGEGDDV